MKKLVSPISPGVVSGSVCDVSGSDSVSVRIVLALVAPVCRDSGSISDGGSVSADLSDSDILASALVLTLALRWW